MAAAMPCDCSCPLNSAVTGSPLTGAAAEAAPAPALMKGSLHVVNLLSDLHAICTKHRQTHLHACATYTRTPPGMRCNIGASRTGRRARDCQSLLKLRLPIHNKGLNTGLSAQCQQPHTALLCGWKAFVKQDGREAYCRTAFTHMQWCKIMGNS